MARRKNKRKTRRRFTGLNVLDAAQAYAQLSIWANATVGLNPWEFLTDQTGGGGTANITLKELLGMGAGDYGSGVSASSGARYGGQGALDVIAYNFKNNWLEATIQSTLTGVGFMAAKKLTRRPRSMANKMLKQLGVGTMVRI